MLYYIYRINKRKVTGMSVNYPETLEQQAQAFATKQAGWPISPETGCAYVGHVIAAIETVSTNNPTSEMLAALWLHDCVDVGDVTLGEVVALFGAEVGCCVEILNEVC